MQDDSMQDDDAVTPDIILRAYAAGIFPMAETADDPSLFWVEPKMRGIIPLDGFHIGRRLARTTRSNRFQVRIDTAFPAVIDGCAIAQPERQETWINTRIRNLYGELFERGYCHSVEVYRDNNLVGGLYGLALGGAFFGESMFHTIRDASKVALVHLIARLKAGNFKLLDTQFLTEHLARFGAIEIPRNHYRSLLDEALQQEAYWDNLSENQEGDGLEIMKIISAG